MKSNFDILKRVLFRTHSLKISASANLAGNLWTALLGLVFVPIYLKYIGIEAYGLIGVFNSIVAFILLLDFGLSPSLNRELARLSTDDSRAQEMRDIKSTLERLNWGLAALILFLFLALSPLIARFWIQPKDLTIDTVTQALLIMSVSLAVQFTINFYIGGLTGLQKQLLLNIINIFCGTLRFVGGFFVLAYYSPTIKALLVWQALVVSLQAVLMAVTLKRSLPRTDREGSFQRNLLHKIWRFAVGMTGISVVSLILIQTDKVILSRMLSLDIFGYYTLAITISTMTIGTISGSFAHAVYPKLSQIVSTNDEDSIREFYHRNCQVLAVLIFPIAIVITFFSYDILQLWLRNDVIVANTYVLLSLVAIGTGLNSLMWLPYYLQLAHGWTKLAFYVNISAIILLIPLMLIGIYYYGAVGGALFWGILNVFFVVVTIQLMHRRILKGDKLRWYLNDLAIPLFTAILIAGTGKLLIRSNRTTLETVIELFLISIITLLITALSTKATRGYLGHFKRTLFGLLA